MTRRRPGPVRRRSALVHRRRSRAARHATPAPRTRGRAAHARPRTCAHRLPRHQACALWGRLSSWAVRGSRSQHWIGTETRGEFARRHARLLHPAGQRAACGRDLVRRPAGRWRLPAGGCPGTAACRPLAGRRTRRCPGGGPPAGADPPVGSLHRIRDSWLLAEWCLRMSVVLAPDPLRELWWNGGRGLGPAPARDAARHDGIVVAFASLRNPLR